MHKMKMGNVRNTYVNKIINVFAIDNFVEQQPSKSLFRNVTKSLLNEAEFFLDNEIINVFTLV